MAIIVQLSYTETRALCTLEPEAAQYNPIRI